METKTFWFQLKLQIMVNLIGKLSVFFSMTDNEGLIKVILNIWDKDWYLWELDSSSFRSFWVWMLCLMHSLMSAWYEKVFIDGRSSCTMQAYTLCLHLMFVVSFVTCGSSVTGRCFAIGPSSGLPYQLSSSYLPSNLWWYMWLLYWLLSLSLIQSLIFHQCNFDWPVLIVIEFQQPHTNHCYKGLMIQIKYFSFMGI